MRKHILLLAIALMATASMAQNFDENHRHRLLSHIEARMSGQYSYALATKTGVFGGDIALTKRIDPHIRLRGIMDFNGFAAKQGFDRYVSTMIGLSADFLPFYVFVDGGVSYNPSNLQKINPAADAGVGLHFDIGRGLRLFAEAGADRTATSCNVWQSDAFLKLGYAYNFGITKTDSQEISMDRRRETLVAELQEENNMLKVQYRESEAEKQQLQSTLEKATAAIESTQQLLQECKSAEAAAPTSSGDFMVYFSYASAELDEIELDRLWQQARVMLEDGAEYRIQGYSSPDGNLYRNEKLAKERALYVYHILIGWGIADDRLVPSGEGISDVYSDASPLNRMVRISKIAR